MSWLRLMEERMKEMETKTEPAAPASRKRNRILHLLSEMWPAYLIEVVVIILGISITLAMEEWRDKGKEEELAKVYLANLVADLDTDRQSLKNASTGTDTLLARGEELQQFIRSPDQRPLSGGRINEDIRILIGRPKFQSHDATFSELKSSGNLHLIKDITLNSLLFAYYGKTENIRQNQDAEQQATIALSGKYFLQEFALDGHDDSPVFHNPGGVNALAANTEFRNQVLLRVGNRQELLALYKDADSLASKLLSTLRKTD